MMQPSKLVTKPRYVHIGNKHWNSNQTWEMGNNGIWDIDGYSIQQLLGQVNQCPAMVTEPTRSTKFGMDCVEIITFFFLWGGGREIIITSCNSWKDATPTLGGRERGGGQSIIITFFFSGGGNRLLLLFFCLGGVPEIIITSCNSWKGATPTLGGRERGEGNRLLLLFFSKKQKSCRRRN